MSKDQELARRIVKDHDNLDQTFASLEATLVDLKSDGTSDTDRDLLEDARADLSFALEEMLEHFGIEEEAIFQQIRAGLPDLGDRLDMLEAGHEHLCRQTSTLRKMVAAAGAGLKPLDHDVALATVRRMRRALAQHNAAEVQVFLEALERLDEAGRQQLRENLESL